MVDEHLLVTQPDRYHGEGLKILFIDWQHDQLENMINMLRGSPIGLAIHVFGHNDTNMRWLLDVGYQADMIVLNMGHNTAADPIKGHMMSWKKSRYFGRRDLSELFTGYIEDPLGTTMSWIGEQTTERNP